MKCYSYDNADKRRRDRRQALTDVYTKKYGVVAKEPQPPSIPLIKRRRSADESDLKPLDSYFLQIEKAAKFHAKREAKRRRLAYHNPPKTEFGITAHAKEKRQAII